MQNSLAEDYISRKKTIDALKERLQLRFYS